MSASEVRNRPDHQQTPDLRFDDERRAHVEAGFERRLRAWSSVDAVRLRVADAHFSPLCWSNSRSTMTRSSAGSTTSSAWRGAEREALVREELCRCVVAHGAPCPTRRDSPRTALQRNAVAWMESPRSVGRAPCEKATKRKAANFDALARRGPRKFAGPCTWAPFVGALPKSGARPS